MTFPAARALCLAAVALAGCAATAPTPPWAGRAPSEVVELVVQRRAFAVGEEEEFEPDVSDRIALAEAVARAIPIPADVAAPAVAGVRYALSFLARGAAWRLELAGEDVFAHLTTPNAPPRFYRAPRLRALLEASFARWDAATTRDLGAFAPRLMRFLDRARARAVAESVVLELAGAPRARVLARSGSAPISLEPGRVVLVEPRGRTLAALALPPTVQIHPGYEVFRIELTARGTSAVIGVPDRDGHSDSDDPARWQPFPLHHDLVLIEPGTGQALFVDVREGGVRVRRR